MNVDLVSPLGFEPRTRGLKVPCSATELRARAGPYHVQKRGQRDPAMPSGSVTDAVAGAGCPRSSHSTRAGDLCASWKVGSEFRWPCLVLGGKTGEMSAAARSGVSAPPAVRLDELDAVIFDMDGVVTDTASVHASAWKKLFDAYLEERSRRTGEPFRPFDIDRDYREHVDGKPRYDGVRDFLHSRGIEHSLPQ